MLLDLRAHELDWEASAIFAIEELLAQTGIRRLRVAVGPILIEDLLFRLADQLRQGPAGDSGDGRVDKGGSPLGIQAADALTGGIQDEFVAILKLLEFEGARLDVHFQYGLGAFEGLALLGKGPFDPFPGVQFGFEESMLPGEFGQLCPSFSEGLGDDFFCSTAVVELALPGSTFCGFSAAFLFCRLEAVDPGAPPGGQAGREWAQDSGGGQPQRPGCGKGFLSGERNRHGQGTLRAIRFGLRPLARRRICQNRCIVHPKNLSTRLRSRCGLIRDPFSLGNQTYSFDGIEFTSCGSTIQTSLTRVPYSPGWFWHNI